MSALRGRSHDQLIGNGSSKACRKQGCPKHEHGQSARTRELMCLPMSGCPLLAQSGHASCAPQCLLLGVKWTCVGRY